LCAASNKARWSSQTVVVVGTKYGTGGGAVFGASPVGPN